MRMLLDVALPNEPFSSMVREGTAGQKIQQILEDVKPEAIYFTDEDESRGAILIVDVPDPSRVPALAEPFVLAFNARTKFRICMVPEDLAKSGLDNIGNKYG